MSVILERNSTGSFHHDTRPYQIYSWLPADASQIKEHRYSAVFPKSSRTSLDLDTMRQPWNQKNKPVLIANGEVVGGLDRLEHCMATGVPAYVVDIPKANHAVLKQIVAAFNAWRRDVTDDDKRIAAVLLYSQSAGELTHYEATRICGLPSGGY